MSEIILMYEDFFPFYFCIVNEGLFNDMKNRLATGSQIMCSVTVNKIN